MSRVPTPIDYWANAMQASMIMAEAQAVIAMRVWGMAGLWAVTPQENDRMVSEKFDAYTRAVTAAGQAAMVGSDVAKAAMKPIRQATRANVKRLAKRGPKAP